MNFNLSPKVAIFILNSETKHATHFTKIFYSILLYICLIILETLGFDSTEMLQFQCFAERSSPLEQVLYVVLLSWSPGF